MEFAYYERTYIARLRSEEKVSVTTSINTLSANAPPTQALTKTNEGNLERCRCAMRNLISETPIPGKLWSTHASSKAKKERREIAAYIFDFFFSIASSVRDLRGRLASHISTLARPLDATVRLSFIFFPLSSPRLDCMQTARRRRRRRRSKAGRRRRRKIKTGTKNNKYTQERGKVTQSARSPAASCDSRSCNAVT